MDALLEIAARAGGTYYSGAGEALAAMIEGQPGYSEEIVGRACALPPDDGYRARLLLEHELACFGSMARVKSHPLIIAIDCTTSWVARVKYDTLAQNSRSPAKVVLRRFWGSATTCEFRT